MFLKLNMNNEHQNELNNLRHRIAILEHMVASSVSLQTGGVVTAKKEEDNTQVKVKVPNNFHRRRTIV